MRIHRARGGVFLRPRVVSDGESDVPVGGHAHDRAEADGEVFREAEEPTRGVLFSLRAGVGAVRVAVYRVIGGRVRVCGAV